MEKPTGVIQKIIESLQQVNALDYYSPIEKDIILHNLRAAYMIFLNIQVDEQCAENRVEMLFGEEEPEERSQESEVRSQKSEVRSQKSEERSQESEVRSQKSEVRSQKSEERSQEPEERSQESEERSQESEERSQEPEERSQESEERSQEPEERSQEPEERSKESEERSKESEERSQEPEEFVEEEIVEEFIENEPLVTEVPLVEGYIENEIVDEVVVDEPLVDEAPLVEEIIETEPVVQEPLEDDLLEFIPDAKPQTNLLFDNLDIPKPEKKSLNDLLNEKRDDNSLGARFQQSSITDLTKAIAINEKFTFIRELFHNSGVDFSDAIQKLNECDNIDSAFLFMEELKHQYLWDTTSSVYLTLCDLVRRRFL